MNVRTTVNVFLVTFSFGFVPSAHSTCWDADAVREHGILQFLNVYNTVKARENDSLMWGDEIEYHIVRFDAAAKTVKVSLTAEKILGDLKHADDAAAASGTPTFPLSAWHPEFGSWMVEATPGAPYGNTTEALLQVELNMEARFV